MSEWRRTDRRWVLMTPFACVLLLAGLSRAAAQSVVAGVVSEDETGRPVQEAEVFIAGLRRSIRTDEHGRYVLNALPPGPHLVEVRLIGYHADTTLVHLVAGDTLRHDVVLKRAPAQLQGVVVREQFRIPDFEEHRRIGLGRFLTREELSKHDNGRLSDVLEQLPTLDVVRGTGHAAWVASGRGPTSMQNRAAICPEPEGAGALDRRVVQRCLCYAHVYLDGVLLGGGRAPAPDLNQFQVHQIEAIEYYAGPASTPFKYSKLDSTCGVLVIHTRRNP